MSSQPAATPADSRRDEVVRATCAVIAREGLDRASTRAIARQLGSTTGVLTHYFRDKNDLLGFVLKAIIAKLELDRIDPSSIEASLEDVRKLLGRILPGAPENELWWRVWLAFTVAALSDSKQAEQHRSLYAQMRSMWTALLTAMQARGKVAAELDPALEADVILCIVDGVGIQALISSELYSHDYQMAIVEAALARLAPR